MMKNRVACIVLAGILASGQSVSVEAANDDGSFSFNPTVLDSKNGMGATVGAEYKFNGKLYSKDIEASDAGSAFDPEAMIGTAIISYSGSGTVAPSKDRNPKNFLEFLMDAKMKYSAPAAGSIMGGAFTKYESNQSFTSKQIVYGLSATYGKYAAFGSNDFVALDVAYGRVDPKNDLERKTALGGTTTEPYYRWNLEVLYMYPIKSNNVSTAEFNYRYFQETNAPITIRNASLDKCQLVTVLLRLKNDMFVAYSAGKLPLDRKNDQVFQIGYSYKLN